MVRRALIVAAVACIPGLAAAQSTAFTYQGELKNAGSPASGLHDIRFKLFDAASGGAQVGSTVCVDNVQVTGGRFTATIDFGDQLSNASARHVEIEVRADIARDCGDTSGYTTLSPRQTITPAPRAVAASTAFSLSAPDGSPQRSLMVGADGRIGIGTSTPGAPLHIASTFAVLNLQDTGANSTQAGYVSYRNGSGMETAFVGFGAAGDPDFTILNARGGGDIVLNPLTGNVGIGTAAPAGKLDVRGSVRLGPTGQFFAPKANTDDRIIRGRVNSAGGIIGGSGFTVTRTSTGNYTINYSAAGLTTAPVIVATTESAATTASILGPTSTTVLVFLRNEDGAAVDVNFNFIIMGN